MQINGVSSIKPKRQKYSVGSIIAIPVPDGKYGFAKAL